MPRQKKGSPRRLSRVRKKASFILHTWYVGGIVLVCLGISFLWYLALVHTHPAPPQSDDPFVLAEYYFNADNEIGGAYNLEKARYYYAQSLREDPYTHPLAWYQLGRVYFLKGEFDTALSIFRKQIQHFDDAVPNVYYMVGLTHAYKAKETNESNEWELAADAFTTYLLYNPESPWGRTDLAWVYFSEGKYDDMIPLVTTGLKYNPNHPWLLNMYGLALLNTGHPEDARTAFLAAQEAASVLSVQDWGHAYPGNNPKDWHIGLESFRTAIDQNILQAKEAVRKAE